MAAFLYRAAAYTAACLIAAFASGAAAAQRTKPPVSKAAAPKPAAAPAPQPPRILVAGIRVVGDEVGTAGSDLRAFSESAGTTIALGISPPAGAGIVEIDREENRLDAVIDDKGRSLLGEGRFASFPKVSADGSGALVYVEIKTYPAPGTTSLTARGWLGMTLASGSKSQRIANVRLEPGRTLNVGTTTVTVKQVTPNADSESQAVTLALPRSLLKTMRGVRFYDAKGEPIESRRTGYGYVNESATLDVEVKSRATTVIVEFDVWQNLGAAKVPFEVSVGLGLPAAVSAHAATSQGPGAAMPEPAAAPPKQAAPATAPAPGDGGASVAALLQQMRTAAVAGRGRDLLTGVYPDDRSAFAQAVAAAVAFSALAHLDDPGGPDKAMKAVDDFLEKHNLKAPLAGDANKMFATIDVTTFVTDALVFLNTQLPKGQDVTAALPMLALKPQNVKIDGDAAEAKLDNGTVTFARVNGRWFMRIPELKLSR